MSQHTDLNPFIRGDTFINRLYITDSDGVAIDITDRVYWITLKADPDDLDASADAQSSVTASGADALAGIVDVTLSHTVTQELTPGTYHYDIQEVNGSVVTTIVYGKVKVIRDITMDIA